jgi:hypothetical protein
MSVKQKQQKNRNKHMKKTKQMVTEFKKQSGVSIVNLTIEKCIETAKELEI